MPPPCLSRALRRWSAGSCQSQRTQPRFSRPMSSSTLSQELLGFATVWPSARPSKGGLGSTTHKFAVWRLCWDQKIFLCPDGDRVWCWKLCCTTGFGLKMFHGNLLDSVRKKFSQKDVYGLVGCSVTDQRATQTVCNTTPLWWLFVSWFDLSTRSSYRPLALHLEKNFPSSALWADFFQTKFLVGCFWLDMLNVQRNKWWDLFKMLDLVVSPLFVQPMLWEDVHFVADDLCPMPCNFLSKSGRSKKT